MSGLGQCPLCGRPGSGAPIEESGSERLYECAECRLQVWRPGRSAEAGWYDTSDHYLAMPYVDWLGWYHSWALRNVPDGVCDLLDVGCADGRFVYAAARQGIAAEGIDHSRRLVEIGNSRHGGDRLRVGSVETLRDEHRTFDLVSMFELIEHVEDPVGLLKSARSMIAPDGWLIVSAPNRFGVVGHHHPLDRPPHHLTRWTPAVLRRALEAAGLVAVCLVTSPAVVDLHEFLIDRTRFGLVTRLLRNRSSSAGVAGDASEARVLIRVKDRLAMAVATIFSPLLGRVFGGAHMVALARRIDG